MSGGGAATVTYNLDDVVNALKSIEPFDWATFLHERVDSVNRPAPLDGLQRGGYRLMYSDTPYQIQQDMDAQLKTVSLAYSIGVDLDDRDGTIADVAWDSPAFKANLTEGAQILAVDGVAYSSELLRNAIRAAKGTSQPIELIVKAGDRFRSIVLDYHDGLRYPHLERTRPGPALLDDILDARK